MAKSSLKNKILFIILLILVFLYAISFSKKLFSTDKRKVTKTALVNQKNVPFINRFVLSNKENVLVLEKNKDFWIIKDQETMNSIPADTKKMNEFINQLSKTRELYINASNVSQNDSFGLLDDSSFHISYELSDNQREEIIFGNRDFSQITRYLMSGKSLKVYEIDDSIEPFLYTSVQQWSEPFIISQTVLGKIDSSDIQKITYKADFDGEASFTSSKSLNPYAENFQSICSKLLDLRHGGISLINLGKNQLFSLLELQLGNKNTIEISFYTNPDDYAYYIKISYKTSDGKTIYSAQEVISEWTYNSILSQIFPE